MFFHFNSGGGFLPRLVPYAFTLFGIGSYASTQAADTESATEASGVSINNQKIVIDGINVPPGTEYFKSPATGDEYRISHRADSITVVLLGKRPSQAKRSITRIKAIASDGSSVNAGRVVIVR